MHSLNAYRQILAKAKLHNNNNHNNNTNNNESKTNSESTTMRCSCWLCIIVFWKRNKKSQTESFFYCVRVCVVQPLLVYVWRGLTQLRTHSHSIRFCVSNYDDTYLINRVLWSYGIFRCLLDVGCGLTQVRSCVNRNKHFLPYALKKEKYLVHPVETIKHLYEDTKML